MKFKSKSEAYTYAILTLYELKNRYPSPTIDPIIEKIKIAVENHEQKPEVVCNYMKPLLSLLKSEDQNKLNQLLTDIQQSDYQQSREEKFENILGRRAESELPVLLLTKPTKAMMKSVGRVSDEILKILADLSRNDSWNLSSFLGSLTENAHIISCGAFFVRPNLQQVQDILKNNDPKMLPEIMHIHFKLAQNISREIPIKTAPVRTPIGKLAEIVKEVWDGKPEDFFKEAISQGFNGRHYRAYIADSKMYASELYTAERGRGRNGGILRTFTSQLGLMLDKQDEYSDFPTLKMRWVPDCRGQRPDYDSAYVKDLIENDTIYVAGPSGMTSMLLGQMEFIANLESVELKQLYLSAIVSYIVGAGFHSLHEVVGPAQYALNLVPGYKVSIPTRDKLAEPLNYNQYFQLQSSIDPEFSAARNRAWDQYITFFNKVYAPKNIKDFKEFNIETSKPSLEEKQDTLATVEKKETQKPVTNEVKDVKPQTVTGIVASAIAANTTQISKPITEINFQSIANATQISKPISEINFQSTKDLINEKLNSFLENHTKPTKNGLGLFKFVFGNAQLESKEVDLVEELKGNLEKTHNFVDLTTLVEDCRINYTDYMKQIGLSHFATKRECFLTCLSRIDKIIQEAISQNESRLKIS